MAVSHYLKLYVWRLHPISAVRKDQRPESTPHRSFGGASNFWLRGLGLAVSQAPWPKLYIVGFMRSRRWFVMMVDPM
jgi:hypothetical protein